MISVLLPTPVEMSLQFISGGLKLINPIEIVLAGAGGKVVISGSPRPGATEEASLELPLYYEVLVRLPGVEWNSTTEFLVSHVKLFLLDLAAANEALAGKTELVSLAADFRVAIEYGSGGVCGIAGAVERRDEVRARLEFLIDSDQSYIGEGLQSK